jgi:nickel transport protein
VSFSKTATLLFVLSIFVPSVYGHELDYETTHSDAVVVRFYYADDEAFSYESYEIFREGEEVPYQTGRTDAYGRLLFLPDSAGNWRIRVFSEDGHGKEITLETGEHGSLRDTNKPLLERYAKLFIGLAFIFGFFGIISLFFRKRRL